MKLALACLLAGLAPQDPAPTLSVRGPSPGVVRLGELAQLQIRIVGQVQRVNVETPDVEGLRIRVGGPETQLSQTIIGGRISSEVSTTYTVALTPQREGEFQIPPFRVHIDGVVETTRSFVLEAVKDVRGNDMAFVRVTPSSTRVYVHEPLRFAVDYGIDERTNLLQGRARDGAYWQVLLEAEWLDELEGAVPIEEKPDYQDTVQLLLNGHTQSVGYTARYEHQGRPYHKFELEKAFLPTRSGVLDLPAPLLSFYNEVGQGRRGLFGERVPGRTETLYAYGEPLHVEVVPIPTEGRPADYYGAVGRFEVMARLERQRVKVGGSLQLVLTIEGRGNTEFLRVPELDDLADFHLLGAPVRREPHRVTVTYDLSPLTADARVVPGIRWNYFDTTPGVERFVTVETEDLPVEVVPLAEGEALSILPGEEPEAVTPGVDDIFDMKASGAGAPASPPLRRSRAVAALWIALPWLSCLALAAGLARRRRTRADVSGRRSRGAERSFQRALKDGRAPGDALVSYVADRLDVAEAAVIGPDLARRLGAAGVGESLAAEAQRAVEAFVGARYGGGGGVDEATARRLVARLEESSAAGRPSAPVLSTWILGSVATLSAATPSAAQADPTVAQAEAAYRAGDYAAAADAFARAAAEPGADRRLLYNLGNSLFRQGELGEALAAYERARLAMPRDEELLANIALVRDRLQLGTGEGEPFLEAVAELRSRLTSAELLWLCVLANAAAAAGLVLLRSRALGRMAGGIALVPAVLLGLEVLWLGPARPPSGIVVAPEAALVSEPREGLAPVLELREGVEVAVLGRSSPWTRVSVAGRSGYLPSESVEIVE